MDSDKNKQDEYPKLSENDKRWQQQEEYTTTGLPQQLEDEKSNDSIASTPKKEPDDEPAKPER